MGRHKNPFPELRYLATEGRYYVFLDGKRHYLGNDKTKAEERRRELLGRHALQPEAGPADLPRGPNLTVAAALACYLREEGSRQADPRQRARIAEALSAVEEAFGVRPAGEFDQLGLKEVRRRLLRRPSKRQDAARSPCAALLRELLQGGPVDAGWLNGRMQEAGYSAFQVSHARKVLGVKSIRTAEGKGRPRVTVLPPEAREGPPVKGLSRRYVNHLIGCIQSAWTWLVSEKLAPDGRDVALRSVRPLREGDGGRETAPVLPADPAHVAATVPFLGPVTSRMVRVQQLTGMRPGEVCRLRPMDISRSISEKVQVPIGDGKSVPVSAVDAAGVLIWVYAPPQHKTRKRGKPRVVCIGPLAQEALLPLLEGRDRAAFVFSPREEVAGLKALERLHRKRGKKRLPGERYSTQSYGKAVARAARRAQVPPWSVGQLRHNAATDAVEASDESTAAALLGHAQPSMSSFYALQAVKKAAALAARLG